MDNSKHMCANCWKSFKGRRGTCGCKNPEIHEICHKLRVPKASSKKKMKKFKAFALSRFSGYYNFIKVD